MNVHPAISFLKESELISKAAFSRNLVLGRTQGKYGSHPKFDSEDVGIFTLNDEDFLRALKIHSFTFGPSKDPERNKMVYLLGNSDQRGEDMFDSDRWAWEKTESNPQLAIYFRLFVRENKRGVVCEPQIRGNCIGGACHQPTIDKLMRVLAEHFTEAHPMIKAVTNDNPRPVIFWGDINLGGIKSVGWLFDEQYGKNKRVVELARSTLSPFSPSPYQRGTFNETQDRHFVKEVDQPKLFRQWEEQLLIFRNSFK